MRIKDWWKGNPCPYCNPRSRRIIEYLQQQKDDQKIKKEYEDR